MSTPITDAAAFDVTVSGWDNTIEKDNCACGDYVSSNLARRLETDRAALMKALQWLDDWLGHKPMPECSKRITNALAAARANFPQP